MTGDALRLGQPLTSMCSLIDSGTPSSGPFGLHLLQRASDFSACFSAPSRSSRMKALTPSLRASMRSNTAFVTSTGDSAPSL